MSLLQIMQSRRVAGTVGLLALFSFTAIFASANGSSPAPSGESGDFAGRVALPRGGVLYLECLGTTPTRLSDVPTLPGKNRCRPYTARDHGLVGSYMGE